MGDALVGQILAGRYDVLALLGMGGMGAVYRARDRELDEMVALKVIRDELAADPVVLERFRSEVKLARRVTHGNVARTFELGTAGGVMFCTMELIRGETLTMRLQREQKLAIADAVAVVGAVLDGLAAAHEANIVHRDIKPDNVLLETGGRVLITDFGVASMLSRSGEASGTPAYMAPEQARGEPPSPAGDVYSVGVMLYELLTGRRAFTGTIAKILADKLDIERVVPAPDDMPAELARVIEQATARDVGARLATARAFRRALEPWARSPRAQTLPVEIDRADVTTIVLLQPTGDPERQYLAFAVHTGIATRLGKLPRIRVLSRLRATAEPDATVVEFDANAELTLTVRGIGTMTLPLGPEDIATTANAATAMIMAALRAERSPMPASPDIVDLVLRARYLLHHDFDRLPEVATLLERAHELAPDNPLISATLANVHVRIAFFGTQPDPNELVAAAALARDALRAGPELAESHLAAGHVELHTGDPAVAALHYRHALARSPHTTEAHEYLGRLLLEAGYVDLGLERLEEALASALALASTVRTQWDIARAYALEARWDEHDQLVAEIVSTGGGARSLLLARFGWWRGDHTALQAMRANPDYRMFGREVVDDLAAVFLDGAWATVRARLLAWARAAAPNRRRRTLAAQLVAEAAGFANDGDTCIELIARAVDNGLFDLHWVDKCPTLAGVRSSAAFATQRARVLRRAEAILDAFYGDRPVETSDTAIAPSVVTP